MELAIVVWIFCGIGAALVAQSRGASGCLWFGLGVLLGPFGLAFAFASGTDRKCPQCRERIHPEATKCPKCQSVLGPSDETDGTREPKADDDPRTAALISALTRNPDQPAPQQQRAYRYCNHCGAVVPEGAKFCNDCGGQIVKATSA
jgi:RNA polymerase subunit RPABC4/transcription elongation factor Spt4